ncbi:MAG: sigma-54-dependent Fis family transcriptional regulator [Methylotenera sp. 17-45-7]|jgi:DNA-binding NtrC family response regulator|nr:MAG: sigma-54-dependent Fis family transcriptional regulator [Mehylophilales bacterium 35-46-6]OZA09850.1 MAG: sigma-54-dependent Fis family transcriptional regulator [Methylotenera sp. 17-45-7]OZA54389.1 MAG: sigma-54-dependent Fis family transcriptional regulator [Methylophilales bacterium 39-45-7]HQS36823.1 sigma-54 dependent transcriptional regulator [Methylotenera sp.]
MQLAQIGSTGKIDSTDNSTLLKQQSKVLIVEDEALFARAVMRQLQKSGYECAHVEGIQDARDIVRQFTPDIVLLDMRLPDGNGLDLLPFFVAKNAMVIVMTAHGEISDAVSAMKQGAIDYLKKPIDLDELLISIQKAESQALQNNSLDYSRQRNAHAIEGVELLGDSPAMQGVKSQIKRIAQLVSNDAVPPTVLINGETGAGKDVAARLLHLSSQHPDKPFVHIDCASLPAELIESELFGHEKGAFTGATATRPGLIEAAEDGTLFLDEIGELPLTLQAKLLNVLERRVVRRLGSTKERAVPARFIAATNRDLHEMSLQGRFRQDLYYRLNVMSIYMPPLRERSADLMLLARHFATQTARRYGLPMPSFTAAAIRMIETYTWPGNVRELRHQVSRAVLLCHNHSVTEVDLALPVYRMTDTSLNADASQSTLDAAEKTILLQALADTKNNVSEAARKLGITRMTMRYRMDKHQIKP